MLRKLICAGVLALGLLMPIAFSVKAEAGDAAKETAKPAAVETKETKAEESYFLYRVDVWSYRYGWVAESYHRYYADASDRADFLEDAGYDTRIVSTY